MVERTGACLGFSTATAAGCCQLNWKSRSWIILGPVLNPAPNDRRSLTYRTSQIQLHRVQAHTDLLSTHSTIVCHRMLYSKYAQYCTSMTVARRFERRDGDHSEGHRID